MAIINNKKVYQTFNIAVQNLTTDEKTFISFGDETKIKDIFEVLAEETDEGGFGIAGMAFLAASSKKKMDEMISDWEEAL